MKTLLNESELQVGVGRMASEINKYYAGRSLTIIGVLTGSVVLLADLIRLLEMPLRVGVVQASSYRGATTARGSLHINSDLMPDIAGRDVLLVDDIFDTGHTLAEVMRLMHEMGPTSVRTCVLLLKQGRREVEMPVDHVGFDIPNEFVVGYGLDYQDEYRNLPFLGSLEEVDLARHAAALAEKTADKA
jgi:hypoxanthine phosphoribosyltransferase